MHVKWSETVSHWLSESKHLGSSTASTYFTCRTGSVCAIGVNWNASNDMHTAMWPVCVAFHLNVSSGSLWNNILTSPVSMTGWYQSRYQRYPALWLVAVCIFVLSVTAVKQSGSFSDISCGWIWLVWSSDVWSSGSWSVMLDVFPKVGSNYSTLPFFPHNPLRPTPPQPKTHYYCVSQICQASRIRIRCSDKRH